MVIVYTYYVLDIVHRGHLLHMENARRLAGEEGKTVVGILTKEAVLEKKSKKPILSFDERINLAKSIRYNDLVIPQSTYSPESNIRMIKPDIVLESESHKKEDIESIRRLVESFGGRVLVMPYYPFISSTDIKKKIRRQ